MSDEEKKQLEDKTGKHFSILPTWSINGMLVTVIIGLLSYAAIFGSVKTKVEKLEERQTQLEILFNKHVEEQNKIIIEMLRTNDNIQYNLKAIAKKLRVSYEPKDVK